MLTVRLIDSYGRVPLLQRGSAIMIASMGSLAVAALFLDMASGALAWTSIVTLSLYVGGYQVGYGPVTWTYISEVFPLQPRGSALALAVLLNFSLNGVVTLLASPPRLPRPPRLPQRAPLPQPLSLSLSPSLS